jgi:hypothetical protein
MKMRNSHYEVIFMYYFLLALYTRASKKERIYPF